MTRRDVAFCSCLLIFCAVLSFAVSADDKNVDKSAVERWVKELADADFQVRDNAQRKLIEAGEAARASVEGVSKSKDVEQRLRASHILTELRRRDVWSPTLITFKGDNVPIKQLFKVIEEQSGNSVNWIDSDSKLGEPLSVHWNGVTVWTAVEEICTRAKLTILFPDNGLQRGWILKPTVKPKGPVRLEGPLRLQLNNIYRDRDFSIAPDRKPAPKKKNDPAKNGKEEKGDPDQPALNVVKMEFSIDWERRFPLSRYEGNMRIREALTDAGEDLKVVRPRKKKLGVLNQRQHRLIYVEEIKTMKNPIKTLKRLVVDVDLVASGDFALLTVPIGLKPASESRGGYTFEFIGVNKVQGEDEISFRILRPTPYDGVNAVDMVDEFYTTANAAGQNVHYQFFQIPKGDKHFAEYIVRTLTQANAATVTAHIALLKSRRTVSFTFTDVPVVDKLKEEDDDD